MKSMSGRGNCLTIDRISEERHSIYLRCDSAKIVSKANDDLPEPQTPVITTTEFLGMFSEILSVFGLKEDEKSEKNDSSNNNNNQQTEISKNSGVYPPYEGSRDVKVLLPPQFSVGEAVVLECDNCGWHAESHDYLNGRLLVYACVKCHR